MLLIGVIAYVLGWLSQQGGSQPPTRSSEPTPLDTLKARCARGEISREEYEAMRRDLEA